MIEQTKTEKPSLLKILHTYSDGSVADNAAALPELRAALAAGADIEEINSGDGTPLCLAAFCGYNAEVISLLLEAGAGVNRKDSMNYTPLCSVLQYAFINHPDIDMHEVEEIVRILIAAGADLTISCYPARSSPLQKASIACSEKVVRMLLDAGADVDALDSHGCNALHYAVDGNTAVMPLLVERGVKLYQECKSGGFEPDSGTPFFVAVQNEQLGAMRKLVELGVDIDWQDSKGRTALACEAAKKKCTRAFTTLLKMGANTELRTHNGETPLHRAVRNNNCEAVRLLLEHGAKVNARDRKGHTPLMYAARNANLKMVNLLLGHGADPTMHDKWHRTALQYAAERGADSEIHRFFYNLPSIPTKKKANFNRKKRK